MIELTEQQRRAIVGEEFPVAVDPNSGQEYLLIRKDVYERMRAFLKPLARGWDNPADDGLTRQSS